MSPFQDPLFQSRQKPVLAFQLEGDFRDERKVYVMIREGSAGSDEPGVSSHKFHKSHSVVNAPSLGMGTVKNLDRLLDRSQITKSALYVSYVVVDRLGNPHDRKCVPAFF